MTAAVVFDAATRDLLDGANFAVVSTVDPGGGPQSSVVWYLREDDTVVFSTTADRRKTRNLRRDPRISLSIYDLADPYRSVEIRGVAEVTDDRDLALPKAIFRRYRGGERPDSDADHNRVIVRVRPQRLIATLG